MVPNTSDGYLGALIELSAGAARRRFRASIRQAWDGRCAYCGRSHDEAGRELVITLDHIKPRCKGGETLASNLLPACRRCNAAKGAEPWRSWFAAQGFYDASRAAAIEAWLARRFDDLPLWGRDGVEPRAGAGAAPSQALGAKRRSHCLDGCAAGVLGIAA